MIFTFSYTEDTILALTDMFFVCFAVNGVFVRSWNTPLSQTRHLPQGGEEPCFLNDYILGNEE
jgi:hypothetical protein